MRRYQAGEAQFYSLKPLSVPAWDLQVSFGGVDMARGLYTCSSLSPPSGQQSSAGCCHTAQHPLHRTGIVGEPPYVTIDYNFELTGAGKIHVFKGLARPDQMNNAK